MEKPHFKLSWQGVGISSRADTLEDPISLHMLAYIELASQLSERHVVVVDDVIQSHNYIALDGLEEEQARRIALEKGRRKAGDLGRVAKIAGLKNVRVIRISQLNDGLLNQKFLRELYQTNDSFRQEIQGTIPSQILRRVLQERRAFAVDELSQYTLDEIAMALSMNGTRISHEKQKGTDLLTARINQTYGIGNKPEFYYPEMGLEVVLKDRVSLVEPYSGTGVGERLLLTDSPRTLRRKLAGSPRKARETALSSLGKHWPNVRTNGFFDETTRPFYRRLVLFPRLAAAALALSLLGGLFTASAFGSGLEETYNQKGSDYVWANYHPNIAFYADMQYGDVFGKKKGKE